MLTRTYAVILTRCTVSRLVATLLLVMASVISTPVVAHSPLASLLPADGATVSAPQAVEMVFKGEARLVRFDLDHADDGVAVDLGKEHLFAASTTHRIPLPTLSPGAYQASWRAMAEDGHVMKGKFTFTILSN